MRFITFCRCLVPVVGLLAFVGAVQAQPGNETIATATPFDWSASTIPNYAVASGVISPYDVDFYQFQVYQGGIVDFDLPGGSGFNLMSPRIDLFDPSGALIGGMDGRAYAVTLDPGVYYPRISSSSNGLGAYNFTVSGASPYTQGTAQIGAVQAAVPEADTLALLAVGAVVLGMGVAAKRRPESFRSVE